MDGKIQLARRSFLAAVGAAGTAYCLPSSAQGRYPAKPVRLITPIPAGGIVDSAVRIVAESLAASTQQPFIVDNRPGGSYTIGVKTAASAPSDGYNILAMHVGFIVAQETLGQFNLLENFTGIGLIGGMPSAITVSAESPFETLGDLIRFGKANRNTVNYVTPGVGSIEHLKSVEFQKAAGFDGQNIAVKGGPEMLTLLIQGNCHYSIMPLPLADQFVDKGQLRYLAVMTDSRPASRPDLPTATELGLNVRPYAAWMGLMAKKGTPADAIETLSNKVASAMQSNPLRKQYGALGLTTESSGSTAEFTGFVKSEAAWFAGFIRDIGFKIG